MSVEKIAYEDLVEYCQAEAGAPSDYGYVCRVYVDAGDVEWTVQFPLCTPLDCLIEATHDDGLADDKDRALFDAMQVDLELMLERIKRVRYRSVEPEDH